MPKFLHLEGLRGAAALIVLLCHVQLGFYPNHVNDVFKAMPAHWSGHLNSAIVWGYAFLLDGRLAVYVFWVLSAYVISIGLFRAAEPRAYLVAAATKRYFRLAGPCLGAVLFAYLLMKSGLMFSLGLTTDNEWLRSTYDFAPNFLAALKFVAWNAFFDYQGSPNYNHVLWSIEAEMYGSFFCFAIFGVLGQSPHRFLIYALVPVGLVLLKMTWLLCFFVGFVLCDYDYLPPSTTGLLGRLKKVEKMVFSCPKWSTAIFVGLVIWGKFALHMMGLIADPANLVMAVLIVYLTIRLAPVHAFLASRPMAWLGKISFSLYLIHLPIICSLGSWLFLYGWPTGWVGAIACGVTLVTSLSVAAIFQRLIDAPSVQLANTIGRYFAPRPPIGPSSQD